MPTITVKLGGHPPAPNVTAHRHWTSNQKSTKRWRDKAFTVLKVAAPRMYAPDAPLIVYVTMTRIYKGGGAVLASDSLPASFKAVRDGVADAMWKGCPAHPVLYGKPDKRGWPTIKRAVCGHDHDDDPRVVWMYEQVRNGTAKEIEITVRWS